MTLVPNRARASRSKDKENIYITKKVVFYSVNIVVVYAEFWCIDTSES